MPDIDYKYHKFRISSKEPGKILTGATTQLFLDGQPIKGCKSLNLNIEAKGLAILTLQLFVDMDECDFEIGRLEKVNPIKKSEEPVLTQEEWEKINNSATYESANDEINNK